MKIKDLSCPKCGASIESDLEKGRGVCAYCGYQILIEKEDTLEEIEAKAQSKSYGYHKGKLKAEAEAEIAREEREEWKRNKKKRMQMPAIIVSILVIIGVGGAVISHLSMPKVNPFECIEVSFRGTDGEGELIMEMVGTGNVDPNRIEYDISKNSNLSQGEMISIIATSTDYRLSEKSKTYVVEGLDEFLKDPEDIPAEALELIYQKAEGVQETNLSSTKSCGFFVDMKPVKLFLLTDGEQTNQLYAVHEVNFDTEEGNVICYVATGFDDVVVRKGAQTSLDMSYGMYYGNLTEVDSPIYITAYASLEEVRTELLTGQGSYMELKERDL